MQRENSRQPARPVMDKFDQFVIVEIGLCPECGHALLQI
jgi:hypothetical protein